MYRANLSHQQLEKYLSILFERDLLALKEGDYLTTERGILFIKKFDEINNFIGEEDNPMLFSTREK